jgi:hypothetical protein
LREDYDDLRFEIAKIKDAGVMQNKHLEQQNKSLRRMVSELEKLKIGGPSSQHRSSANNEAESSKEPRMMDSRIWSQDKYRPKNDGKCWFCGGPHLLNDCDEAAQYGKRGMIAKIRGRWRLLNGDDIPGDPERLWKDRLDEWYGNQKGSSNYNTDVVIFHGAEDDEDSEQDKGSVSLESIQAQLVALQAQMQEGTWSGF